jgi:hypothetical protein
MAMTAHYVIAAIAMVTGIAKQSHLVNTIFFKGYLHEFAVQSSC